MARIKEERLQIRVGSADKALLERAAAASHLNVSAFVVQAAASKAEEVLAERSSIRLSAEAATAFTEALERPAEVNERLGARCVASASSAGLTELQWPAPLDPRRHKRDEFDSGMRDRFDAPAAASGGHSSPRAGVRHGST